MLTWNAGSLLPRTTRPTAICQISTLCDSRGMTTPGSFDAPMNPSTCMRQDRRTVLLGQLAIHSVRALNLRDLVV